MKNLLLTAFLSLVILFSFNSCNKDDDDNVPNPGTGPFYTSTKIQTKKVILEEFTGVKCPFCPEGHVIASDLVENNPGNIFSIRYHPSNTTLTVPYDGNPDFRRTFPNALFTTNYCLRSTAMPGAFINRKVFNSDRLIMRDKWAAGTSLVLADTSPINVGLYSSYNSSSKVLTVKVEVYFTSTVTENITLNVLLMENGLIAQQSGATIDYEHKHIFREALTDQLGDEITGSKEAKTLITKIFTFDNSGGNYNMANCELIAFVSNADAMYEVITGNSAKVGKQTNK